MTDQTLPWHLAHHFAGLPCEHGAGGTNRRRRWWARRSAPMGPNCDNDASDGVASIIRDAVTRLLSSRGLEYAPVGEGGSWLWCLGGPSLYRHLPPQADGQNSCLDLTIWVCEQHRLITAELYPYDIVPESGGTSLSDPVTSTPVLLGDDLGVVVAGFIGQLETWLDEILVKPTEPPN